MNSPQISNIDIARISVGASRRAVSPNWVATLAHSIAEIGLISPIEVFETLHGGEGFSLITGAHRLAAVKSLGWTQTPAIVLTADDLKTQSSLKQHEIAENLIRNSLSALDRSFDIAEWRDIYLAANEVRRGRRPKTIAVPEWEEEGSAMFALNFPEAAQKVLNISRRAIFLCLKVASIGEGMRQRIALHPVADNQSELLLLAAEPPARQKKIADLLLLPEGEGVQSVSEAIARIDSVEAAPKVERWQKFSQTLSGLKEAEQFRVFDANRSAIDVWLEARKN